PYLPAATTPEGVRTLATAIGKCGSVYGARCRRVSLSSNQSVFMLTGSSQRSSAMIAARDSSIRGRCVDGSMPSMYASETRAPGRQVGERDEGLGEEEGVGVGRAGPARAEHDVPRPLGGCGDEDLRRGDQLPARRVVLADPRLVIAEMVEPLDQLHVPAEGERGVLPHPVKRSQENSEFHPAMGHGPSLATLHPAPPPP